MISTKEFFIQYGLDHESFATPLPNALLDAELLELKRSRSGALLMKLQVEEDYPEGISLYQAEEQLGRAFGILDVKLALRSSAEPSQDKLDARLNSVLSWLAKDMMNAQPLLAQALAQAEFTQKSADTFTIALNRLAYEKLGDESKAKINEFIRLRGGLQLQLDYFCQKNRDEDQTILDSQSYLKNVQERFNDKLSQTVRSVENEQPGPAGKRGARGEVKDGPKYYRRKKLPELLWGRMYEVKESTPIGALTTDSGVAQFVGKIKNPEFALTKSGSSVKVNFNLEDSAGAVSCLMFIKPEEQAGLQECLKQGSHIRVEAELSFDDRFSHDLQAKVLGFMAADEAKSKRKDQAAVKRVELHAHTKLSAKDALCDPKKLVKLAAHFGHEAVAITDHGVVQAFPDAAAAVDELVRAGQSIKLIYGMEGYLVDDGNVCVYGYEPFPELHTFVALDVETTGLDANVDRLIEVAAVRYVKDEAGLFHETDKFQALIQPGISLPQKITQITGITDIDLLGQPAAQEVLHKLSDFIAKAPVVAHNALFDLGFLRAEGFRTPGKNDPKLKFNPCLIDTLQMARSFLPDMERYSLDRVAAQLGVSLNKHHRAEDDARCCAEIFIKLYEQLGRPDLETLNERAGKIPPRTFMIKKYPVNHIILLAGNALGMYHLYRLVSESHIRYINTRPRIPRSLLDYLRQGLLLGSACEAGEVFRSVKEAYVSADRNFETAQRNLQSFAYKKLARYYDYLEIQPLCNNRFLLNGEETGILFDDDLMKLNQLVQGLAKTVKKPLVATCDVHFLNQEEGLYRQMMLSNMGYSDAAMQADLYFRTTDEMLAEFTYLGPEEARQAVIDNPRALARQIEADLRPFPQGSFPPEIPEAEIEVTKMCYTNAQAIYDAGDGLPDIVAQRIKRELDSIITHGFAIMYYIAHKVVKKSNDDGYIVGSRGSVGSSLVATLCGITEVNPLVPHYYCKNCHYSEFDESGRYGSGYDLPAKDCPGCGSALTREGQDIPFETFLGFSGDKQPDIDLNFSGEYQSRAHLFIEEMFGPEFTFRAGTIGAYAEKNAEGLVRNYLESINKTVPKAEIERLAAPFVGVKRTTGQHPGGIVVIPKNRDIYEFTPVQYPADNQASLMQTTHFDFNALHETILKLDILGHDDPTVLHMLSELTGVDVMGIPIPDPEVMAMFRSTEPLRFIRSNEQEASTLGIPEMGTLMARDMIAETQPSRFYDLVQLMGLSHGTDVWKGNAQTLIQEGICDINNVIGCRDSIMTTLIYKGLPSKDAFDIMEKVRKGKGLSEAHEALMREHHVEDWYIDSCKKIKYMFPKAHAVAYAISSLRVAWFKVHHPAAYYSAYFTVRADEFDSSLMCVSLEQIMVNRRSYRRLMQDRSAGPKEKNTYYILELVEEMYNRGLRFAPIDLLTSEATKFMPLSANEIRPPFNVIPGFSSSMAKALVETRTVGGPFNNREELGRRAQLGPVAIKSLAEAGVLDKLPESAQMSFFDLLAGV